mmetsp:Transcript_23234/g.50477  ORF Transcript_23234/g.50477 Transcript_23234/m.50477 type:complete len:297 (+) Transcript_23234:1493-2383(+)
MVWIATRSLILFFFFSFVVKQFLSLFVLAVITIVLAMMVVSMTRHGWTMMIHAASQPRLFYRQARRQGIHGSGSDAQDKAPQTECGVNLIGHARRVVVVIAVVRGNPHQQGRPETGGNLQHHDESKRSGQSQSRISEGTTHQLTNNHAGQQGAGHARSVLRRGGLLQSFEEHLFDDWKDQTDIDDIVRSAKIRNHGHALIGILVPRHVTMNVVGGCGACVSVIAVVTAAVVIVAIRGLPFELNFVFRRRRRQNVAVSQSQWLIRKGAVLLWQATAVLVVSACHSARWKIGRYLIVQ